MDHLWSPWRSVHIDTFKERPARPPSSESLFTRLLRENDDEKNLILWRGERVFVIMNLYPYNNGHVMIVPNREEADFERLTPEERAEISETISRCIRWIRRVLNPEGFNVGMNLGEASGAGVPAHIHMHVVPRWNGDTNFMPTIAEVKVVPQALRDTYDRLKAAIAEEDAGAS